MQLEEPGVILKEEFIDERGLSNYKVSKGTGISQTALGEIVKDKRSISAVYPI
jgi:plasmid maintenance system antidote protein VapI